MNLSLTGNLASLGAGPVTVEQSPGKNHQSGQKDNIHSSGFYDLRFSSLAEEVRKALPAADILLPSLDAAMSEILAKFNNTRPSDVWCAWVLRLKP
jgi:hypothetical protein